MQTQNQFYPAVSAMPVVSRTKFAELVGVSPAVVLGWVNRGYLPTINVGKYSLINLALLNANCLNQNEKH